MWSRLSGSVRTVRIVTSMSTRLSAVGDVKLRKISVTTKASSVSDGRHLVHRFPGLTARSVGAKSAERMIDCRSAGD